MMMVKLIKIEILNNECTSGTDTIVQKHTIFVTIEFIKL